MAMDDAFRTPEVKEDQRLFFRAVAAVPGRARWRAKIHAVSGDGVALNLPDRPAYLSKLLRQMPGCLIEKLTGSENV